MCEAWLLCAGDGSLYNSSSPPEAGQVDPVNDELGEFQ